MPLPRSCPGCGHAIAPTTKTPEKPPYWARGSQGEGWLLSTSPPTKGEVASTIAFRCGSCRKEFRLILAAR